jgi:hydroxymethylpyrimidine pyrophosphatase-like HAD family hydrolase
LDRVRLLAGVDPDEVLVMADGGNDMDMLNPKIAGHFACPENATDSVKKRVTELGGQIYEGRHGYAMAKAIEKLTLK